jgi:thymidylate synthase
VIYFYGIPFNYIQAALIIHMVAHVCELDVGEVIYNVADTHIYLNHIDALKEQITREPYQLPTLVIKRKVTDINDFKFEDFELQNYNSHPAIKADVAI